MASDEVLDAACAVLVEEDGLSTRVAGRVLGLSHESVRTRAERHRHAPLPVTAGLLRLHTAGGAEYLRGYVDGRKDAMAEPPEARDTATWDERLSALEQDAAAGWQTLHVRPYASATSAVSKLRLSGHAIERGGSWQFRAERDPAADKDGVKMGKVMALWRGTPCTNCGGVSEDERTCPLCGADKDMV